MSLPNTIAALQKIARNVAGASVVYARGADEVELTATVGKTDVERDDRGGAIVRSRVRDYLIAAEDLVLAGEQTEPRRGDQIRETDDAGRTLVYEVLPIGAEPAWRWSDPYRRQLRIHTKLIDTI